MDSSTVDFKFVEDYLKNKFSRPFARKLKYIYTGFSNFGDTFVFSDTLDTKFVYCEPLQTTGLARIKNKDHLNKLLAWFSYLNIDLSKPYIIYLNTILSLLNKLKLDSLDTKIEKQLDGSITIGGPSNEPVLIARLIETHYSILRIQTFIDKYTSVFFDNQGVFYDVVVDKEEKKNVSLFPLSFNSLKEVKLLEEECNDFNLVLIAGMDVLIPKSLVKDKTEVQPLIRVWKEGDGCLNYGGFYKDEDIELCTSRDNIFVFPLRKTK